MKAKRFSILRSVAEVERVMADKLPEDDVVYKFISNGGFSSISFVIFIADKTKINRFYASTLSVGKKQLKMLDVLHSENKLDKAKFVVGSIMEQSSSSKYGYYDDLVKVCKINGWEIAKAHNHSKLLLFDTEVGKFVIETSSNLNENPKFEQFSIQKSAELFDYYAEWFENVDK